MNIREEIDKLKDMLETEEDFGAIFEQFMAMVESPKFLNMGKRKKNKFLETVVIKALDGINMGDLMGIRISYIRSFNFYHGSFIASMMPGTVIYFTDIKMGLITIPRDLQGNNSFFRFTGALVGPGSFTSTARSEETH